MSEDNREDDRSSKNRPQATRDESYDVGYGKPPKHTQFAKGKSGNPRGRPRKREKRPIRFSDAMSERFLEEEAYRTVTLRENGQPIELPVVQAVMRSLVTEAIKGKRLHQKYALEMIMEIEELNYHAKLDRYIRLQELKRDGEELIERHRRKNLPPPELLPHPDDIVLNPVAGDAYVSGPETKEDLKFYEQSVQMRNYFALCSVHAKSCGKTQFFSHEGKSECTYLVLAQFLDRLLPARFRWMELEFINLMMEYRSMMKRARVRLLASEFARLQADRVPPRGITPEVADIIERARKRFRSAVA